MTEDTGASTVPDSASLYQGWAVRWTICPDSERTAPIRLHGPDSAATPSRSFQGTTRARPAKWGQFARTVAWTRAYLACDDPRAATVCFHKALDNPASHATAARRSEMRQLAEDLALAHLQEGNTDDAAAVLRTTSDWERSNDIAPAIDPQVTVVARNPLKIWTSNTPGQRPAAPVLEETYSDDIGLDEITRVFRPA